MKEYVIGGKKYTQSQLVLGQYRQLLDVIEGVKLAGNATDLMATLGDKVPFAAAIVLTPVKPWPWSLLYTPQRKNVARLAKRLSNSLDVDTSFEVMADFFTCNPVQRMMETLAGSIQRNGLNQPASTSPAETSPKEEKSSGATLQRKSSRGSKPKTEK